MIIWPVITVLYINKLNRFKKRTNKKTPNNKGYKDWALKFFIWFLNIFRKFLYIEESKFCKAVGINEVELIKKKKNSKIIKKLYGIHISTNFKKDKLNKTLSSKLSSGDNIKQFLSINFSENNILCSNNSNNIC